MTYDELLVNADNEQLIVKEKPLINNDGRIYKNRIAIRTDLTTIEKSCVLPKNSDITILPLVVSSTSQTTETGNRRCGQDSWAYDKKIGLHGIINAYEAQHTNIDEMADSLDVKPEFLRNAIKCYKGKYSPYTILDNHIIYFEPNLSVAKMIWD